MASQNADGWATFFLDTAIDERLAAIVGKLRAGIALEDAEVASAEQYLSAFCLRLENIEHQRTKMSLTGLDKLLQTQIGQYADSAFFLAWWQRESRVGFSDEFVAAVTAALQKRTG